MVEKTIESVCTYCGVGCEIQAHIANEKISKIVPQPLGVVNRGKLCIKGKEGFSFLNHSQRPHHAMIKQEFIEKNKNQIPSELYDLILSSPLKEGYYECDYTLGYDVVAWKFSDVKKKYGSDVFMGIGGARTNCESGYIFQKFIRTVLESPHIDNCARVCHSPSLAGLRSIIGEGAATNPFDDIFLTDFMLVIGSNTTEAHPIVANRILERCKQGAKLAVIDIRPIQLAKKATWNALIPTESNLMILNMMARVIIEEKLYDETFIQERTRDFDSYKEALLNDPYSDPQFFNQIEGYENLTAIIPQIARAYAQNRSMIIWGLGITEHIDGSYTAEAIAILSLLTGNIGGRGKGLMPLRGQNNVQGACDVGCLPYYAPDYQKPERIGLTTPEALDVMLDGKIKVLYNIGEDLLHIHANLNKVEKALDSLECIVVNEVAPALMTKKADICFGVKSAYEKYGVYVNAERRLHLSQPLVVSSFPDDWEVLTAIAQRMGSEWNYHTSENVWDEVRSVMSRYQGASYERLSRHNHGLQWPVHHTDTPILHLGKFRTKDGLGHFKYRSWEYRGQIQALCEKRKILTLSTGRLITHYNNAAQTRLSERLMHTTSFDVLLIHPDDAKEWNLEVNKPVIIVSYYGETAPLMWQGVKQMKRGVLFTTFHFHESRINYLFGDEADVITKTSRFKAIEVTLKQ